MNYPKKNVDPLAHRIREALESQQENEADASGDHINAMRLWHVFSCAEEWTDQEKEHLHGCERCRAQEMRVRHTVSDAPTAGRSHDPVMEVTVLSEGGLATSDPNSPGADEVHAQAVLSSGVSLDVRLRRDRRGSSQDELHLTVECEDTKSVGRLLALDISGSESVVNSFIMLAPSRSGRPSSHRKWNTSMMASRVGENIQLWLKEKTPADIGVFEAELLPEAARLSGPNERRTWLAWAEAAMLHVATAELSEEELLSSLKSDDVVLRMHAALVLAGIREVSANCIEELIERLADPEEAVRFAAAMSPGVLKQAESAESLLRCLEDEPLTRRAVAKTLGEIGAESSVQVLADILASDPQAEVREYACKALGQLGSAVAVQELFRAAKDAPDDYVRIAAYGALTGIESPVAAQAVVDLRNEGLVDSLADLPAYACGGLALTLAEEEIVPHFLLPALYGTAVASLSSPMEASAEHKEVSSQQTPRSLLEDSPVHSLALGNSSTEVDGISSGGVEPVRQWFWEDVCETTLGRVADAASIAAEWSATRQALSVWLEAPTEATGRPIEVQWINAEGAACMQAAQSTEHGIAELPGSRSPVPGDRLVVSVTMPEGEALLWEVVIGS